MEAVATLIIEPITLPPARSVEPASEPMPPPIRVAMSPVQIQLNVEPPRLPWRPRHPGARLVPVAPHRRDGGPVPQPAAVAARDRPPTATSRPAPSTVADDGSELAALEAAIYRSVRAAAYMPEAARNLRREGRVLVRFNYIDGIGGGAAILRSAGSRVLDDAALQAVRLANYPAAPGGLRGHRLELVVWISFSLVPA